MTGKKVTRRQFVADAGKIGLGVMIIAGWKLLMGMIGSFGFSIWTHEVGDGISPPSSQTKFVKRNEEHRQVENNNEDHQVFIPVVSVY